MNNLQLALRNHSEISQHIRRSKPFSRFFRIVEASKITVWYNEEDEQFVFYPKTTIGHLRTWVSTKLPFSKEVIVLSSNQGNIEFVKDEATLELAGITDGTNVTVHIRGAVSPPVESVKTKTVPAVKRTYSPQEYFRKKGE